MRHYRLYMEDILEAMKAVQNFVVGMDFNSFVEDDKTTSAVVQKLQVIGEAVKNIPDPIRKKNPQVPWQNMTGMRDWIVHAYFRIDYPLVWDTIKNMIPPLLPIIAQILKDMEDEYEVE